MLCNFFFFNDTATTEIYTLSLHDALPIFLWDFCTASCRERKRMRSCVTLPMAKFSSLLQPPRSEEHTSELQSQSNLVCRLLLEKKKKHGWSRHGTACELQDVDA